MKDKKAKSVVGMLEDILERQQYLEAKIDLALQLLATKKQAARAAELVREISGEIDVVSPADTFVRRNRKTIGGCSDDCMCKQRRNPKDPLPYA